MKTIFYHRIISINPNIYIIGAFDENGCFIDYETSIDLTTTTEQQCDDILKQLNEA